MKDKRPIEEQVAELNEKQRRMMPKLYWIPFLGLAICVLLSVMLSVGVSVVFDGIRSEAKNTMEEIELKREMMEAQGKIYYNEEENEIYMQALDTYYDLHIVKWVVIMAMFTVILLGYLLIAQIILAKCFPYYSEKRYFYLKKHGGKLSS